MYLFFEAILCSAYNTLDSEKFSQRSPSYIHLWWSRSLKAKCKIESSLWMFLIFSFWSQWLIWSDSGKLKLHERIMNTWIWRGEGGDYKIAYSHSKSCPSVGCFEMLIFCFMLRCSAQKQYFQIFVCPVTLNTDYKQGKPICFWFCSLLLGGILAFLRPGKEEVIWSRAGGQPRYEYPMSAHNSTQTWDVKN